MSVSNRNQPFEVEFSEDTQTFGADFSGSNFYGFSPEVTIEKIEGGHKVSIEDINGTKSFDVMDGEPGKDGTTPVKGVDYYTPEEKQELIDSIIESMPESGMQFDGGYVDDKGFMHLTNEGKDVSTDVFKPFYVGYGGGGGGAGGVYTVTLENLLDSRILTVAAGKAMVLKLRYSSVDADGINDGAGIGQIIVNGVVRKTFSAPQGEIEEDVAEYLKSGDNQVSVKVRNSEGVSKGVDYSITVASVSIASTFDVSAAYTGEISFPYTPVGIAEKTVHFELDGEEIGTETVSTSGRQVNYTIPAQSHGNHVLRVWFDCTVGGAELTSNVLYYNIICYVEGNTKPIIAISNPIAEKVEQNSNHVTKYRVYDPSNLATSVTLEANGEEVSTLTVDRTEQSWSYRPTVVGELEQTIRCGDEYVTWTQTVTESRVKVEAETQNLELYLSSYGRSNNEANPGTWGDAELSNFNFVSDGWQLDENGATVLRVSGDARVTIPVKLFEKDFRTTGKTIEIKLVTRDVLNYDAPIITCWSGDRGLKITAQKAMLKSEQSEIYTQYKENDEVHLAFVVTKKSEHHLLMIYIDGILSGVVQYPEDDDFSQANPVEISIGSNECTTDLYCIRLYNNDLTRYQIVENWNAEMQLTSERVDTYQHNDVFDAYGQIVLNKLPSDLPYLVLVGSALPTYKGNKLPIDGYYVDPNNSSKSFTFTGAEIDVQGTSSAGYERKNYKIKFKEGFIVNGEPAAEYVLGENNLPANVYTFKADVASSEGANNVELVKLYNDISPYRTAPQQTNSKVRQGIDGYPIVIFHDDGTGPVFIGKYNFNHDKASDVFGFDSNDESWEIRNNTSNRTLFKSADFSGTDWLNDFEGRYPDGYTNPANLAPFVAWVASTDRDAVTSEVEKAARLEKFKNELENWVSRESSLFYYLFTELFLLADSRAKNAFPTKYDNGKWCWLPYDMDTAIGINNEGKLAFGYELEDTDLVHGAQVYTGQQSVFWNNIRDAYPEELMAMYQKLRSDNVLSYEDVERRFEDHQKVWPEVIFNEDAYYKYLAPLFDKNNGSYLGMLQGSKEAQRKWWLYNRFRYIDSKYNAGDALKDFITLRGYSKGNVTVTPYADIYATVKYGSYLVQERALRGDSYVLECPVDDLDDTEIYIYSASQIADLGDLKDLKVGYAEFAAGTKLTSLKLGDGSESYTNPNLTQLYAGNNVLLRTLDVRNCPNLGNTAVDVNATPAINLSGCTNIENVYFDNTAITGVTLPNGGILKKLHLPSTITNLTIRNQPNLTEFVMPSTENVTTLRLENAGSVDAFAILMGMPANSRVRLLGISVSADSYEGVKSVFDKLDTMRGLDENGNNMDKAQVSGTVHIGTLTGSELASLNSRYPSITVTYDNIVSKLFFYNDDGTQLLYTALVENGGNAMYVGSEPTKASTAQYEYDFVGWSKTIGGSVDDDALANVTVDRNAYAVFTATVRTYRVRFYNDNTLLQTVTVPYGGNATYTGSTPTKEGEWAFTGFVPDGTNITGNTDCYAQFKSTAAVSRQLVTRTISGAYESGRVAKIGTYAFNSCNELTSVDFPIATSVGKNAFNGCHQLTSVYIPAATSVGESAFGNCKNLTSANFPVATSVGDSMFSSCSALASINIPKATSVGSSMFSSCSALTSVDLPSVTYVGPSAFRGCSSITAVILRSTNRVCQLGNSNAFNDTPIASGTGYIYVPRIFLSDDDATKDYRRATNWSTYTTFRALEDYTVDGTITGELDPNKI